MPLHSSQTTRRAKPLLGTLVEVSIGNVADESAAFGAAFSAIQRVHTLMSAHEPDSDLSRINREAHVRRVQVTPWTWSVLAEAQRIHEYSHGLFDCAVGNRLAAWGLLPTERYPQLVTSDLPPSLSELELLEDNHVRTGRPLGIDLGGIAKGFAVDMAIEALRSCDVQEAVVNAGGDMRVIGNTETPVHLRDPKAPGQLIYAGTIQDAAFATSGSYFSSAVACTPEASALVDPRTQSAIVDNRSYSIIAKTCVVADALTKVLAVSGDPNHSCFAFFDAKAIII